MTRRMLLALAAATLACASAWAIDEAPPASLLWAGAPASPGLTLRAELSLLPLGGDCAVYADLSRFDRSTDAGNPFHDKAAWLRRLDRMKTLRMNALVLLHYHPFALFVDYGDRYPEATYLTPDQLRAKQDMLRWLLGEARSRGIKLYFLTYNIWLPAGFARAHGLEQSAVDSPLTREYTAWTVAKFFETFPGFGGLIMHAAESPPGCADFVEHGVVAGLRRVTPRPEFILWDWCSYPWQVKQVLSAYDGPKGFMSYLQYEQFFASKADPRLRQMAELTGNREAIALGGPKAGNSYLLFANPEMVHDVLADFHRNLGRGIVMEALDLPGHWLAAAAFCRYSWSPTEPYRDGFWEDMLAARYGSRPLARPLLTLFKEASLVLSSQMKLTHSQSGAFCPQVGMPLIQVLEMGSISTYIFENSQALGPDGYIHPNMGLCIPSHGWGPYVLPVRQYVLGLIPNAAERQRRLDAWLRKDRTLGFQPRPAHGGEVTPLDVAAELGGHVAHAQAAMAQVSRLRDTARSARDELRLMLGYAAKNIALGEFYVHKDRAAVAWERYRLLGTPADATRCVAELESSVRAWRNYAAVGDRLDPGGVWYQNSVFCYPPPWAQTDFWNNYSAAHCTRMAELTPLWEREVEAVRERLAGARTRAEREELVPPLMDEIVPWLAGGRLIASVDFEGDDAKLVRIAEDSGRLTDDPAEVLDGRRSLVGDSRKTGREWTEYMTTDPAAVRFRPNARYQIRLRYRVLDGGDGKFRPPFAMALRSPRGGDVGDMRMWGRPTGTVAERVFTARTGDFDDYYLFLSIHGPAAIAVDDIAIQELP